MRYVAVLVLVLVISACQTTAYQGDETSPFYLVPVGSRLVLNRALTVPANDAGVYIQNGEVARSFWGVKSHYPYCALDMRKRLVAAQTVQPDEFTITRVSQETVYSVRADFTRLARLSFVHVADTEQGDGASYQIYATVMTLHSERQPDVMRLTCAQWQYPPLQQHVTIAEMRKTLGDLFTLRLPTKNR